MTRTERYLTDLTQFARVIWPNGKVILAEGKPGFEDGDIVLLRGADGPSLLARSYDWWAAEASLRQVMRTIRRAVAG